LAKRFANVNSVHIAKTCKVEIASMQAGRQAGRQGERLLSAKLDACMQANKSLAVDPFIFSVKNDFPNRQMRDWSEKNLTLSSSLASAPKNKG